MPKKHKWHFGTYKLNTNKIVKTHGPKTVATAEEQHANQEEEKHKGKEQLAKERQLEELANQGGGGIVQGATVGSGGGSDTTAPIGILLWNKENMLKIKRNFIKYIA
jgi:1-deoxy-D-xylulose 5-phosphate reductoisomerase